MLRNTRHHRDNWLFLSWEALVLAHEEARRLPSGKYLFGSLTPQSVRLVARYYLPVDDFRQRLRDAKMKPADLDSIGALWERDLRFADIAAVAKQEGVGIESVYVDVMPTLITAMHRVRGWLARLTSCRPVVTVARTSTPSAMSRRRNSSGSCG